jgi:hypothetical protein
MAASPARVGLRETEPADTELERLIENDSRASTLILSGSSPSTLLRGDVTSIARELASALPLGSYRKLCGIS